MKKSSSILANKDIITAIAIGGFDGMHVAHQELFKNLGSQGAIISIESGYANLTPKKYRQEYTQYPLFYYILEDIKDLEADKFINLLKKEFKNLKKIVVGFDFCFGKDRKYNIFDLKKLFDGEVIIIDEIKINKVPVHSRIIRTFLEKGDIETANKFLGREYKIYGNQIKGQGLGKKSFVPTINLNVKDFLLPKNGVYITKTILDNKEYPSVSFLGHRITTDGNFAIETHIINEKIINKTYISQIKFYKRIRNNKKFDNFEELKKQISKDIKEAISSLS